MEPLLDPPNVVEMVHRVDPFVNETIWIGMLNYIDSRVKIITEEDKRQVEWLKQYQTKEWVWKIVDMVGSNPKIRWKDSYKKMMENGR